MTPPPAVAALTQLAATSRSREPWGARFRASQHDGSNLIVRQRSLFGQFTGNRSDIVPVSFDELLRAGFDVFDVRISHIAVGEQIVKSE
jgi:hypothetical protein